MSHKSDMTEDVILDYADYDCCEDVMSSEYDTYECCEETFLAYYGDEEIGCYEEVPYSHGAYTFEDAMYETVDSICMWTANLINLCLFIVVIYCAFKVVKKVYTVFKSKVSLIEDSNKRIAQLEEMLKEQAKNQEQCNISNTEIVNNTCTNKQEETNNNITPIDDTKETEKEE